MAQDRDEKRSEDLTGPMDLDRLEAELDRRGAELGTWPEGLSTAARTLVRSDARAAESLAAEERMERLFAEARSADFAAPPASAALSARMMADARSVMETARASRAAPAAAAAPSAEGSSLLGGLAAALSAAAEGLGRRLEQLTEGAALGGGIGLAAAAGLAVSLLSPLSMLEVGERRSTETAGVEQIDALALFDERAGEDGSGASLEPGDFDA